MQCLNFGKECFYPVDYSDDHHDRSESYRSQSGPISIEFLGFQLYFKMWLWCQSGRMSKRDLGCGKVCSSGLIFLNLWKKVWWWRGLSGNLRRRSSFDFFHLYDIRLSCDVSSVYNFFTSFDFFFSEIRLSSLASGICLSGGLQGDDVQPQGQLWTLIRLCEDRFTQVVQWRFFSCRVTGMCLWVKKRK